MFIRIRSYFMTGYSGPGHKYRPVAPYGHFVTLVKNERYGKKVKQTTIATLHNFYSGTPRRNIIPANGFKVWKDIKPRLLKYHMTPDEIKRAEKTIRRRFLFFDKKLPWKPKDRPDWWLDEAEKEYRAQTENARVFYEIISEIKSNNV